jgi:hypothetical protein
MCTIVTLLAAVAFLQWRRAKRLTARVAQLEIRLNSVQLEHDALMIVLRDNDEEDDDPTPPPERLS